MEGEHRQLSRLFYSLMKFRVQEILLVSSLYDAFIIEEEGLISELLIGQYRHNLLSSPPRVTRVNSGHMAMKKLKERKFDLVITMSRNIGTNPYTFGRKMKKIHPELPVILLATDAADVRLVARNRGTEGIDKAFFWTGDPTLFLAIIKYVEDRINAPNDTANGNVRVIVMVEDSIRYYSMFLPIFYTEIVRQTRRTLSENLNEMQRLVTQRARPKILLAETFEEGMELFDRYLDYVLGVITDVRFERNGEADPDAGYEFSREIRKRSKYIPILMQSSELGNRAKAEAAGTYFLHKNSPSLLQDFRHFLLNHLGFGDFIFCRPKKRATRRKETAPRGLEAVHDKTIEIARASSMQEFVQTVRTVPLESIRFHAERNHFSNWLFARCEFKSALKMRPRKVEDFTDLNEARQFLLEVFNEGRREKQRAAITEFSRQRFEFDASFTRLTGDSLGGKGRGIAFIRALLARSGLESRYKGIRITVPSTVVLGTLEFERFLFENKILEYIKDRQPDDREVARIFLKSRINRELRDKLSRILDHFRTPLAIRSSGLLEDSHDFPYAGVYRTYMLPNNHGHKSVRLRQLCRAIKLVYASTYYREARSYIESTSSKIEEEKMAVIIQEVVGHDCGGRYYPTFSGVVQSNNFYPVSRQKPEDGIASLAVGLGMSVVGGERVIRFSPRQPDIIPEFSSVDGTLANSQTRLYVLDTSRSDFELSEQEDITLRRIDIADIRDDGSLDLVAGTYDAEDGTIRDGMTGAGPPVVNFAGILKYDAFPLCAILQDLIDIGREGMGCPVELEFAVDLHPESPKSPRLAVLQIRPLDPSYELGEVTLEKTNGSKKVLIRSGKALGNGISDSIRDIVYVRPETFDPAKTTEIAEEVAKMNASLTRSSSPYILIGPGRWGTQDRWLGVPVRWSQISGVRVMVETASEDFNIEPSQGTHFFQNIVARGIGYIYVGVGSKTDIVDWEWISGLKTRRELRYVRHVRLPAPLTVKLDGRLGQALVLKPPA
jgi:hypothetical protein